MTTLEILASVLGIISVLATAHSVYMGLYVGAQVAKAAKESRDELAAAIKDIAREFGSVIVEIRKELVLLKDAVDNKYASKELVEIRFSNLLDRISRIERHIPDRHNLSDAS